jgi:hypothetical protein
MEKSGAEWAVRDMEYSYYPWAKKTAEVVQIGSPSES